MTLKEQMDTIYREFTLDGIPWNVENLPDVLTGLVESGWVLPCEGELQELFEPLFFIEQLCTIEVAGKKGRHMAVKALMSKKDD